MKSSSIHATRIFELADLVDQKNVVLIEKNHLIIVAGVILFEKRNSKHHLIYLAALPWVSWSTIRDCMHPAKYIDPKQSPLKY